MTPVEDKGTAMTMREIERVAKANPGTYAPGPYTVYRVAYQSGARGKLHNSIQSAMTDLIGCQDEARRHRDYQPIYLVALDYDDRGNPAERCELNDIERGQILA